MREIKFEYIFKEKYGMNLHHRMFTIEDLENYEMDLFLLENSFEIVARRQSTNLKDKNGKEICEGDIVRGRETTDAYGNGFMYQAIVEWDDEQGRWIAKEEDEVWSLYDFDFEEIIGNVYESPELIKTT